MTNEERIKADAEAYALPMVWVNQNPKGEEQLFYEYISSTSYIAGATAEHDRVQVLVDALETINSQHRGSPSKGEMLIIAHEALEQWKGKEPDRPCSHCGKELGRDRNLCCRECGKEVEDE